MDTTRSVFFSALFASLLLAAPAFTDPPQPTPTGTPSWFGIGSLAISDPSYDVKHHPLGCEYTPRDDNSAYWDCYAWDQANGTDWNHEVGTGVVVGDFVNGPGTDDLWAVWKDGTSVKVSGHDYRALIAVPYANPAGGGYPSLGPAGATCSTGNTTSAERTAIANDYGTNGGGFRSYPSCQQQSWNHGGSVLINTYLGSACYSPNAWGSYTSLGGVPNQKGAIPCSALHAETAYQNGWVQID